MGEILGHEVHLDGSLRLQTLRLGDKPFQFEGPVLPAPQGNRAEGAPVIAALAHLQIAHVPRPDRDPLAGMEPPERGRRREQAARPQFGHEAVEVAQPEQQVDLGERRCQFIPVALDHAPHRHHPAARPLSLQASGLEKRLDRFFLRRIDEPARVDEDDFGLRRVHALRAVADEFREQALRVDRVLVAAEADEA